MSNNFLLNYVLVKFNDGREYQYLIKYPKIYTDENYTLDTSNAILESLNGSSLLARSSGCIDGQPELVDTSQEYICADYPCGGSGHDPGDDRCKCGITVSCSRAYSKCSWQDVQVWGCGGGSNDNSNNSNTGTTGGDSTNNNDQDDEDTTVITTPFEELTERSRKKECKKIKTFLDNNAAFKQKLKDLANPNNFNQNLDVEFEKYIGIHENETNIIEKSGTNNNAKVNVDYIRTYPNKLKAFAHTHPNDALGTYSVFSFEDFEAIARMLFNDKIDTGTFVAFLITKKGNKTTHYALTIHNKRKFKEFFHFYDHNFKILTASQEEKDLRVRTSKKLWDIKDKYYGNDNAKINSNNVNTELMLNEFTNFLREGNMGASVFETDANFENFANLSSGLTAAKRKPCN